MRVIYNTKTIKLIIDGYRCLGMLFIGLNVGLRKIITYIFIIIKINLQICVLTYLPSTIVNLNSVQIL